MATHATPPAVHKKCRRRSVEEPLSSGEEPVAEASLRRPRPTEDKPRRVAAAAAAMSLLPAAAAAASSSAPAVAPGSEAPQQQVYRRLLAHALRQGALAERREARERLAREPRRLGTPTTGLYQDSQVSNWEGGAEAEHLGAMKAKITDQKAEVERAKKEVAARNRQQKPEGARPMTQDEADEEIWERREFCNTKLEAIRREELELTQRERRLARERADFIRLRDAVSAEDKVCFDSFPTLQDRYQLLRVTGHLPPNRTTRVFSAYDMSNCQHCCVRLHQLPGQPSGHEARLRDVASECEAIRAATREYRHPGLLQLLDFFRHDGTAGGEYRFATVWESCGADNTLEVYLLRNGPLPEKEARGIALQLLSALRYAESGAMRLERADLKIQNIGFTSGEVKVAVTTLPCLRERASPAGLAASPTEAYRRLGSDHLASVDSQDPSAECEDDPVAEVKAQLWSLLIAMLYGKLRSGAAPHEAPHEAPPLPDQPRVTDGCRDFLNRLHSRDRRVKLQDLYNDPFVTGGKRQRTAWGAF